MKCLGGDFWFSEESQTRKEKFFLLLGLGFSFEEGVEFLEKKKKRQRNLLLTKLYVNRNPRVRIEC